MYFLACQRHPTEGFVSVLTEEYEPLLFRAKCRPEGLVGASDSVAADVTASGSTGSVAAALSPPLCIAGLAPSIDLEPVLSIFSTLNSCSDLVAIEAPWYLICYLSSDGNYPACLTF